MNSPCERAERAEEMTDALETNALTADFVSAVPSEGLQTALLPCPFCGFKFPADEDDNLIDVVYPTGSYAHWMDKDDHSQGLHFNREPDGAVHELSHAGCTVSMGGCGASVVGFGRDGAMSAWNRRAACEVLAEARPTNEKAPASAVDSLLSSHRRIADALQGMVDAYEHEASAKNPALLAARSALADIPEELK